METTKKFSLFGFAFWMFVETGAGIIKEYMRLIFLMERSTKKNILTNSRSAAVLSMVLAFPLGLILVIFMYDMESLAAPLKALLTVNGYDINPLGRLVVYGGMLLLPVAFVINAVPMLRKDGPDGTRTLHAVNVIVGAIILLLITFSWGALMFESIDCLQGIRCD